MAAHSCSPPTRISLWQIQFSVGICVGLGIALIGNVPNSILLGRWFGPRLPTAMAVVYSATGAGVLVLLPASQVLIDHVGWRGAYQIFRRERAGAAAAASGAAMAAVRDRLAASHESAAADVTDEGWTLAQRGPPSCLLGAVLDFLFYRDRHVCDHAASRRLSDRSRLSAVAGGDRLGIFRRRAAVRHARRLLARRHHRTPAVGAVFLRAVDLGIFLLWLLQWHPNIWILTGFVVCFGSMIGSRGPLLTATAMKLFRGKRVGTIYGSIAIGSGLGSAFGSWSGGLIHDSTHSYNPLILYALVSVIIGMIPFLVVPALRR